MNGSKQVMNANQNRVLALLTVFFLLSTEFYAVAQKRNDKGVGKFSVNVENGRVSPALAELLDRAKVNYTLNPALQECYLTLHLKNVSLSKALSLMAKASAPPFTYLIEKGVYRFAVAGNQSLETTKVTLQTQNSDLPGVIASLMQKVHANYLIDPEIKRTMNVTLTLNLKKVPFSVALETITNTSELPIVCMKEAQGKTGALLYHFMLKSKAEEIEGKRSGKFKYDNTSLARGGELYDKVVTLDIKDLPLTQAIKAILSSVSIQSEIDESIQDKKITLHLENIALPEALRLVTKSSGQAVAFNFEKDVLHFVRKK